MSRAPKSSDLPEPDRIDGAPHPRETRVLLGQGEAEARFLDAFAAGRLHHGWMLAGPRGVGKATLAWKIARFLLATPPGEVPRTLDVAPDHPVARRILALSEPRLHLLRRGANATGSALSADIRIDEVRRMKSAFTLAATDGGRRVAIVDAADDLSTASANALLKLLEEPPQGVTLLLVTHQPFRLLPTIRSRCRTLRLGGIGPRDMAAALAATGREVEDAAALAELSAGSVGEAVRILALGGSGIYADLIALLSTLPRLDRPRALALAETGAGRGAEDRFDMTLTLTDLFLARLARAGSSGRTPPEAVPGEAALMACLAPGPAAARGWADLAQTLSARVRQGRAVNLDPAALLMDMLLRIDETAGRLAPR